MSWLVILLLLTGLDVPGLQSAACAYVAWRAAQSELVKRRLRRAARCLPPGGDSFDFELVSIAEV